MSLFGLLRLILSLATVIASSIKEARLLNAGQQKQLAQDLAALQERLKISKQVEAEVGLLRSSDLDVLLTSE